MVFPDIAPAKVSSIESPDYNVVSRTWRSGDSFFTRMQYTGVSSKLLLEYRMISDSELDQLINIWETSEGCFSFTIPISIYKYVPTSLVNKLTDLKSTSRWTIDSEPIVTPKVLSGNTGTSPQIRWNRYDVDVVLISQIS